LAAYIRQAASALERHDAAELTRGAVAFPDPAAVEIEGSVTRG
jgi:hypothetical protein